MSFLKKLHSSTLILILVLGLSAFFRFWHLSSLPYSLHDDEVMNTYIGRFVLENGQDVKGNSFPLIYFNNFGDYSNIWPMYLSGASTYIFGVNALGARFPIALLGTMSIIVVYFLTKLIFNKPTIPILAALFLAVCPWHIILSRATAEGIVASFFFMLGTLLFFHAINKQKLSVSFFLANLLLFSTYLIYPSFRITVPLFLLPSFLLSKNKKLKQFLLGITILAFALTLGIGQTEWGSSRFKQTSIFTYNQMINSKTLNYSFALGPNQATRAHIFNHRYVLVGREFLRQYFSYFSPKFLAGDSNILPPRYNLFEEGTTYWILIFIISGLIVLQFLNPFTKKELASIFKSENPKFFFMLIWMLLIIPIPGALTLDDVPNIHRTVMMSFIWAIIFATSSHLISANKFMKNWKKLVIPIIALILAVETTYFWHVYTSLNYESNFIYRDDAKKLLAQWLIKNGDDYDQIFIPNHRVLALHYLFFKQDFSPTYVEKFGSSFEIDHFENIYPVENVCLSAKTGKVENPELRIISVTAEGCNLLDDENLKFTQVDKIERKNLTQAFIIQEPL